MYDSDRKIFLFLRLQFFFIYNLFPFTFTCTPLLLVERFKFWTFYYYISKTVEHVPHVKNLYVPLLRTIEVFVRYLFYSPFNVNSLIPSPEVDV